MNVELGGVYVNAPFLVFVKLTVPPPSVHDLGVREGVAGLARGVLDGSRQVEDREIDGRLSFDFTDTTGLAATEERLSVTVSVPEVSLSVSVAKY